MAPRPLRDCLTIKPITFAPYLILGATVPAFIADPFLDFAEEPDTWGDINLARKALAYGRMLRDEELDVEGLAAFIRVELCLDAMKRQGRSARGFLRCTRVIE